MGVIMDENNQNTNFPQQNQENEEPVVYQAQEPEQIPMPTAEPYPYQPVQTEQVTYQQMPYSQPEPKKTNVLALLSMIFGITGISLIIIGFVPFILPPLACCCFSSCLSPFLSLAAIVLGFIALKNPEKRGMTITGLITGGAALLIIIIPIIIGIIIAIRSGESIYEYFNQYSDYGDFDNFSDFWKSFEAYEYY